jgi:hypothetical protein
MTTRDEHGNPISGGVEAAALFDGALHAYLRFSPAVIDATTQLVELRPDAPMGHALTAYLYLTSTDEPDVAVAKDAVVAMASTAMNEREALHHGAAEAWVAGDWTGAASILDDVLRRWPTDLLALLVGHQLDFFVGDAANLRDRPARSLPELDPDHPHTGFVRGMHAFGLEEAGHYGAAEDAGLAAVEANADDVWAIHAVTHVREMEGRVDEGIRFLRDREADWGAGNLFTVHNWWHLGLFHLEAGDVPAALAIYDAEVHNASSAGVPLELLDASALLWRLLLDGVDTGDRWAALADVWATRTGSPSWYAFNDLHAVMALVGAGRVDEAERHVELVAGQAHRDGGGTNIAMLEVGLPACTAALRFAQGRHDDVVAALLPVRRTLQRFGGSHAQRDAMQRTLLESALRSNQLDLARSLIDERLTARDTSVYGWLQRARLERARGDAAAAADAAARAEANRARFAAAL